MKRILFLSYLFFLTGMLHAADIPDVVIGDDQYNQDMCVERSANDCINTMCLTSEDRDCQDKCQTDAEDKCKEQSE
ncbi:hypothetical protein [Legionella oakridgensis]|uniref:Uncharacterized protein n=2 Tax=Legionella oakridgensis TaxID=29423 RepID=W0BCV9_9GAMM|nr:hypothetical protein [Legionella oakridgensis]AHE67705.1 hypothetical protein Loa_02162 [Legionella oakridgensis ATCC 33761 = DSM 21215]ETO92745.1 hypothetical protein LOR_58c13520 [Legionella oakridgensis RV-2-2007]KTD36962.1 hypothetical protein Loak_2098 [Legionella oakridgensis]STY20729.1 Uncharacterised protein [Legionella longbeachae]